MPGEASVWADGWTTVSRDRLTAMVALQAGEAVKAMKALLQSGDEERVTRFAQASRSRELYLLAAQFLQASGRWRGDPAALRTLAAFYAKAKSPQHTAAFHEGCAQAALDDGPDFGRAEAALAVRFRYCARFAHISVL